MGASEKAAEGKSVPDRLGAPLLISLFAMFALLFALSYLAQGASTLIAIISTRYDFFTLLTQMALTGVDLLFGVSSLVVAAGLFFHKEWARKAWLVFVILTVLVGIHLTVMQILAGYSGMARVYGWIVFLVFVAGISWAYLPRTAIKSRFN